MKKQDFYDIVKSLLEGDKVKVKIRHLLTNELFNEVKEGSFICKKGFYLIMKTNDGLTIQLHYNRIEKIDKIE